MKYRTYPVTVSFQETYLPPRCRKPRYCEAKKTYNARIRTVTKEEAPVAFILSDHSHREKGTVKIRLYKGKLYILDTLQHYGPGTEACPWDCEFIGWRPTTADRLHLRSYSYNASYEDQAKELKKKAQDRLIIDGLVWKKCGEPMYAIVTFGLGHNHGGTGLFVETYYNSNIGKNRYFTALQGDEAVDEATRIALRRGDDKSVPLFEKMIEVRIPECVKRNPQKEHGDGNPFLNTLDAITDAASSPLEAGLLAVMMAIN